MSRLPERKGIFKYNHQFKCDRCGDEAYDTIGWAGGLIEGQEVDICPDCCREIAWEWANVATNFERHFKRKLNV